MDRRHEYRGALHAVDPTSGAVLWTYDAEMEIQTQPIVVDGFAFVVSAEQIPRSL